MTLPKAISDAIDAYREKVWHRTQAQLSFYTGTADREGCMSEEGKARAALERAIAEHVAEQASSKDGAYRERRAGRVARVRQGA